MRLGARHRRVRRGHPRSQQLRVGWDARGRDDECGRRRKPPGGLYVESAALLRLGRVEAAFAALLLATGLGALRNGMFPRLLAWATVVIGATLLTPLGLRVHPLALVVGRKRPVADPARPSCVASSRFGLQLTIPRREALVRLDQRCPAPVSDLPFGRRRGKAGATARTRGGASKGPRLLHRQGPADLPEGGALRSSQRSRACTYASNLARSRVASSASRCSSRTWSSSDWNFSSSTGTTPSCTPGGDFGSLFRNCGNRFARLVVREYPLIAGGG